MMEVWTTVIVLGKRSGRFGIYLASRIKKDYYFIDKGGRHPVSGPMEHHAVPEHPSSMIYTWCAL